MMGKLMKYDLKSMLKVIVPFWIAMFVTGILWSAQAKLTLLDINVADSRGNLIMGITMLLFLLLIMAVVVMNIVVIIQRFWKGLLKEEGYLMFTIPVSERSLILSKVCSGLLVTIGTIVVIILMSLVMGIMHGMRITALLQSDIMRQFVHDWGAYTMILGIVAVLGGIYHLYAAMAIGQLSSRNRFICSFAAYIVLAVIVSLVENLILGGGTASYVNEWFYVVTGAVEIILYHIATEYILKKKLNLE
ncbi:MAG TPA: hypothetical protein H9754_07860 [Candidatus Anaerostipes avistercoris]|uniref:Uncharacterized protein n=1 Tax=Candidatus Anaerostipes avistercoris TaxID=2838462 RepID=A0A9D2PJ95_9FIRM|nr:hypothetical protein [uncultured Anaerostipes sp.]HJC50465.1 hypothetical protein [Candidatus Anaerostipes avistercoris]